MKHRLAYSASILLPLTLSLLLLVVIPKSHNQNVLLNYGKIFWLTGIMFVATNAIGLFYGKPKTKSGTPWNMNKRLIITYVSKGDNSDALLRAIATSKLLLEEAGVNYMIEAVTDMPVNVGADKHLVVPEYYETPHHAKYKARALEFARVIRPTNESLGDDIWILHLDEESIITPEAIEGINHYINQPSNQNTIGQGEIKYNAHKYGNNLLITAIDSLRTGDDLGRFRFQYKMFKKPLFGMHGSFVLVPSLLEDHIGFDLGTKGSITEDAYFALICAAQGIKFGWVEGFIREQSPFTLLALLKQRRRWITGLHLLVFDKTISRKQRWILGVNMTLWRAAWISPIITIINFLMGGSALPFYLVLSASLVSGMVGVVYMVGAYRNIIGANLHWSRQVTIWSLSLILVPVCCIIEGIAVLYSILYPINTFDVVAK
jgi:egghead protein (zeste-white 4 protein)